MSSDWTVLPLGERSVNLDRRRVPVKGADRRPGPYPYYGASGVVDYVDGFIYEGLHLLIAEDGENLRSRKKPVAFLADGKFWVNNHAHILQANEDNDLRFLAYAVEASELSGYITGSAQPKLTQAALASVPILAPALSEQRLIANTLGAIDGKIASNLQTRTLLRALGVAKLRSAQATTEHAPRLGDLTVSITRGVTPKYADDDKSAPLVVNQRCIRDGWVTTAYARRMTIRKVTAEKRASAGDILVNSTGVGTLGRVGRWHAGDIYADSHVSIVKPDPTCVGPTVLAYALFGLEREIEAMATGSTGQTELSPHLLADLVVELPSGPQIANLETELFEYEQQIESLLFQEATLSTLRRALIPELVSGRLRLPGADGVVREGAA